MQINLSDYSSRKELERYIERKFGNDLSANFNSDTRIRGTQNEMDRFLLSPTATVYGIQCEIITKEDEAFTPKQLRDNNFVEKYGESENPSKGKGRKKKN